MTIKQDGRVFELRSQDECCKVFVDGEEVPRLQWNHGPRKPKEADLEGYLRACIASVEQDPGLTPEKEDEIPEEPAPAA